MNKEAYFILQTRLYPEQKEFIDELVERIYKKSGQKVSPSTIITMAVYLLMSLGLDVDKISSLQDLEYQISECFR